MPTLTTPPLGLTLLCGGQSDEHDVSLMSGQNVLTALDTERYTVTPVVIGKDGMWQVPHNAIDAEQATLPLAASAVDTLPAEAAITLLQQRGAIDVAFIIVHGQDGEDGRLQQVLEAHGVQYTGSNAEACAITFDKQRFSALCTRNDLPTPTELNVESSVWQIPAQRESLIHTIGQQIGFPCVVKPASSGSSVGVSFPENAAELAAALDALCATYTNVIIQEKIVGPEVTCGVLEIDGVPTVLPPTLIRPKLGQYFDYASKYTPGGSEEITPAPLPQETIDQIQSYALKAHTLAGCSGMSRTDMMIREHGVGANDQPQDVLILEINTIPGMTKTSLLPQAAEVYGLTFSQMLDRIIAAAL